MTSSTNYTTIQLRRDTKANWESVNPVPSAGEPCVQIDTQKLAIGDGTKNYKNLETLAFDSEVKHAKEIADRTYKGVNLAEKHSIEISDSYANDAWAWIKARTQAGNFEGIHIGDYIPFSLSAGTVATYAIPATSANAVVMGINTYKGYGDTAVGNHIDFKFDRAINKTIPFQTVNYNNGGATYKSPYMSSIVYAVLNGVNNVKTDNFGGHSLGADASAGGILQLLPTAMQNVLIQKRLYIPTRYSASGALTEDNGGEWNNVGKLFILFEPEIYDCGNCWGGSSSVEIGRSSMGMTQYPIFANTCNYGGRVATTNGTTARVSQWLASARAGYTAGVCGVAHNGFAYGWDAAYTGVCVVPCFRVG